MCVSNQKSKENNPKTSALQFARIICKNMFIHSFIQDTPLTNFKIFYKIDDYERPYILYPIELRL